jgi:hypothetical protein
MKYQSAAKCSAALKGSTGKINKKLATMRSDHTYMACRLHYTFSLSLSLSCMLTFPFFPCYNESPIIKSSSIPEMLANKIKLDNKSGATNMPK